MASSADFVAPLVGAWIEMHRTGSGLINLKGSLLSWERGLKFAALCVIYPSYNCRSSRGSVD